MKVSIITASYNNEQTIKDTIKSVLSQSYDNIEYIIIDGKSSDNTINIIQKYSESISKLISETDSGIYDALNKGINSASGDIIGFLHADDIYNDENSINRIVKTFNDNKVDSVYGDLLYVSKSDTNKIIRKWISGNFKRKKLKYGWMPPHPTFFVKKTIYENLGSFDTSFKIAADYDLILRFLGKHNVSVQYSRGILIKMRIGGESNKSIKNILRKMREDVRALKKNKLGNWHTVILKNLIKIPQLFLK